MVHTAEVVICGAGISGIATAYHLAVTQGVKNVCLIDERPPLTLTSDKSSEAYRNWWPDEVMVRLLNRSIDWLERWAQESGNRFLLNRRGYVYLTANPAGITAFKQAAQTAQQAGAGEVAAYRSTLNQKRRRMCSNHQPQTPVDWRVGLRNGFSNWNQPLPTRTKVRLLARNLWIRVRTRSNCCGHDGEPGC